MFPCDEFQQPFNAMADDLPIAKDPHSMVPIHGIMAKGFYNKVGQAGDTQGCLQAKALKPLGWIVTTSRCFQSYGNP